MKRLMTFLKTHGLTIFFGAVFITATCILRPTLDKHEEDRIAKDGGTRYAAGESYGPR
ncbi:hypothetical protein [Achromobacter insolitus]|uniref:hypothetical protein n=1 Tax=Achromobacter insolitus TaxID=217204 RepID=UPI0020A49BE4|nr:hypothetical protein [Achromobacter insolitus]MCP1404288.1 hypothetical protein [Achromobacter insolitus]